MSFILKLVLGTSNIKFLRCYFFIIIFKSPEKNILTWRKEYNYEINV